MPFLTTHLKSRKRKYIAIFHTTGGTQTMKKRIIALFLCLASLLAVLSGCGSIKPTSEYKGQQVTMYLSENVYDLDPIHAYINESTRSIVSMLFDTLFSLDENGKVKPSLAKSYSVKEFPETGEYYMYIELKDTNWSDNTPITADDVVYAWKRVLAYSTTCEAASLLYDIKGVRDYIKGDVSEDDIGITADNKTVTIQFEIPAEGESINYDQFILNLTSLALAPLRENIVSKGDDWAKKPGTMVCSGPFKLARISFSENSSTRYEDINYDVKYKVGDDEIYLPATESKRVREYVVNSFILERNVYYYRDSDKEQNLDISVAPYRIIVDCAMDDEDIKEAYDMGVLLYMGDIPMSLRQEYKNDAIVKDSLSTTSVYFNQNAEIDGEKLFAVPEVRQALSMAIDRAAIAEAVVFADVANGLVPTGVFNADSAKTLFRDASANDFKYLKTDLSEAKALLKKAGIDASDYSFNITVAAYDEVHLYIAEAIAESWQSLGFDVETKERGTVLNNDYYKHTDSVPNDICDDLYAEDLRNGDFEVVLLDVGAVSVDPFSVLAPYAKAFSGQGMDMSDAENYQLIPHVTGYDSEEYNALIESIYAKKNADARTEELHQAEAILMEDMPVVPILFNKTAVLVNDALNTNNKTLFWKKSSNYYVPDTLKSISISKYDEFLATYAEFLESKFEKFQENPLSYFGSQTYCFMTFEEFKAETTNYSFLFPKDTEETK